MSKRVFITNATGYIGAAVAKALKARGYDVTSLARSEEAVAKLQEQGIKPHRGDLRQSESFSDAVRNADVVIHTASTNDAEFGKYDLETVDTILQALQGTNNIFIYTSGTWVLGDTAGKPADETTKTNPAQLVTWRVESEKRVQDAAKQGVRTVVIRPTIVYGGSGGIVGQLFSDAKKTGEVKFVGNGENRWSTVHIDDLAELYVLAVEKAAPGSLYHAGNGQIKVRELAELVAKAAGIPGRIKGVPVEEARTRLGLFADALTLDQEIDATKARKELGWQPKRPQLPEEIAQNQKSLAGTRN